MLDDDAATVHRDYRLFVGGEGELWQRLAELQFQFAVGQGLTPGANFLDIGCGALRGGTRFIGYLEAGRYHGVDKHIELIIYGVAQELGLEMFRAKAPRFAVSADFEFAQFATQFEFCVAQSLFTHLTAADIFRCLSNLGAVAAPECRLYATFFETARRAVNRPQSHSHAGFHYTRSELSELASMTGWSARYVGGWGHPRNQKMMEFVRLAG
jgi:hypothetical protein